IAAGLAFFGVPQALNISLLRRFFMVGVGAAAQGAGSAPPAVAQPWSRRERHRSSAAFDLTPQ
ncbi:hypothetical protein ACLBVF_28520, partial [Pseudomonas aeruginosa]|uniref:hypothetical protein n=1 Tax=Pseudomonas aeruginosa TaxID=287 RepID=UPI003968AA56